MIIDTPTVSDIPALRSLWSEAFGDGEQFLDDFFSSAFAAQRARCVKINGSVCAALYWFDCSLYGERIAYVYAVATAQSHRNMGLCSRLMSDTHSHLGSLGYKGALLVPGSAELFSFYERLGYKLCSSVSEFSCTPGEYAARLRRADAEEYAHLRRALLPDGGVIQENENIRFLKTQAELYVGDGFVFAARRSKNTLYVTELIGKRESAPSILRALDCELGYFRTIGTEKPFAMYLPLCDQAPPAPRYFGLAFD